MTEPRLPRDWDAATYDRVSTPQLDWAAAVLDRLALEGGETVLDAGCGSGRVTEELVARLPRGRVIAVDAAPSMVAQAQRRLGDRADVRQAELTALELDQPVDAVFSNAVFHWVLDHDALFRALFAALHPGGRLVAQCGGAGNIEAFHAAARAVGEREPFAPYFEDWPGPWNFASPHDTALRLEHAGFADVECSLEERPTTPPEPGAYIRAVCLGPHLERLPEELREEFADRTLARAAPAGNLVLDYVRLDLSAVRHE